MDRNIRIVIIIAVVLAVILSLFYHVQYSHIIKNEAHRFLIAVYGGVVSSDGFYFLPVLTFSLPFLVQLLLFADTINKDFNIAVAYIFPRKNTRTKWLLGKFKVIFIYSVYFYLLQFTVVLMLSMFFGYKFDFTKDMLVVLLLLITYVNINSLLVMIAAILSIRNKTSLIFSSVFAVYFAWFFLLPIIKEFPLLFQSAPFSHVLLFYHAMPADIYNIREEVPFKSYIPLWSTILYGVLGMGLLSITSTWWFKKTSLMEGA